MAGITPDISVSSFKPLSLDEIMMVPLAKQKQEDDTILALDELNAMRSNALAQDQDYVNSQADAFLKESNDISNLILNEGIDRSLVNKVRGLRQRKNKEFSISGRTGQAAAAFDKYEANKQSILKRTDLSDKQKRLGLETALKNYQGVENAGVYEDYIGAKFVNVAQKGIDIALKMKPEERAAAIGLTYNPQTKTYSDGTKSYKKLTPNHIKQVVYGALKRDEGVQNYLSDLERIGGGNAEQMLQNAAISAGEVGEVNSIKDQTRVVSNPYGADKVLSGNGAADVDQEWNTMTIVSGADKYNRTYGITEDMLKKLSFKDGKLHNKEWVGDTFGRKYYNSISNTGARQKESREYKNWKEKDALTKKLSEAVSNLRKDDPQGFMGRDDEYVLRSYVEGARRAASSAATINKPTNNSNSLYEYYNKTLLGRDGTVGDMTSGSRSLKIMGYSGKSTPSEVAEELGFKNIKEFNSALMNGVNEQGKAVVEGIVNDPDIPMGIVVHMKNAEGISHRIVVSPDSSVQEKHGQATTMMNNLRNGIGFSTGKGVGINRTSGKAETHNEYYVNKAQNIEGLNGSQGYVDYTPIIIRSRRNFTEDEARRIEWDPQTQRATLDGKYLPNTNVMTYDEQTTYSMNKLASRWNKRGQGRKKNNF